MSDKSIRFAKLAAYKNGDGDYEFDGCIHTDATRLLGEMLGFCGCGLPAETLQYTLAGLELIDTKPPSDESMMPAWYQEHRARCRDLFVSEGAEYFFYYWASERELTEHGGGVPGWLTDDGQNILSLLREWDALVPAEGE